MDAKRLRKVRDLVYAEPKPQPKWPRKPFHLSWRFDLFVVLATIVLVIAYFAV